MLHTRSIHLFILEHNVRQGPVGLVHITGVLVSVAEACGLGSANPGPSSLDRRDFLFRRKLHTISIDTVLKP